MRNMFMAVTAILASIALIPSAVRADQPSSGDAGDTVVSHEDHARTLVAEGDALFAEGRFDDAASRFRSAYALSADALILVRLGDCAANLDHRPEALQFWSGALRALPQGNERQRVEELFNTLRPSVGGIQVSVNEADATVAAGSFVGESPVGEVFVLPGRTTVSVKKAGFSDVTRVVDAAAGSTVKVDIQLTTTANRSPRADLVVRPRRSLAPAYIVGGAAVALLGTGAALRVWGDNRGSDADTLLSGLGTGSQGQGPCVGDNASSDCGAIATLREDHDNLVNAGTGLLVVGGVALVASLIYGTLVTTENNQADEDARPNGSLVVAPGASQEGASLTVLGRF